MRKRDRVALYCFLGFSIFIFEESWRLGLGSVHRPGPGFLPSGAALIIMILAILQLVAARGKKVQSVESFFQKERLFKFLIVVVTCFGFGLLLYYFGLIMCTGLFVLISLRAIEPKRWGRALFISVTTAFASWLLFDYWLKIQAPKGTWVYPIYETIRQLLWK